MKSWTSVDEYMAGAPKEAQPKLRQMRAAIREVAPDAVESISYGMPFYSYKGEQGFKGRLCYFGLVKAGIAFYMRPQDFEAHTSEVAEYKTTKSALQFPRDEAIPFALVKKLVMDAVKLHKTEDRSGDFSLFTGRARKGIVSKIHKD
jgi:uncharacterized protein YdhG (YjbR/CyaY superfamily)